MSVCAPLSSLWYWVGGTVLDPVDDWEYGTSEIGWTPDLYLINNHTSILPFLHNIHNSVPYLYTHTRVWLCDKETKLAAMPIVDKFPSPLSGIASIAGDFLSSFAALFPREERLQLRRKSDWIFHRSLTGAKLLNQFSVRGVKIIQLKNSDQWWALDVIFGGNLLLKPNEDIAQQWRW